MAERSFLSDVMRRVAFGSWAGARREKDLADACRTLLRERSEAAGLVLAREILDRYEAGEPEEQQAFFAALARDFGADADELQDALDSWEAGSADAARRVHYASEPESLDLIRVLNRVPGATSRLVRMRADLLKMMRAAPELSGLDSDFRHLFTSWFNRGFLELRRIDWSTPAAVLEKIIAYEAVHEITGWDDLRQRVADPDRRLFGFFHPAMPGEPLIFVEVALMDHVPGAITEIIAGGRETLDPDKATVAVFYSISNCQQGLAGISFGNFLIKQVVAELSGELQGLETFVTLSPVPGLRRWVAGAEAANAILGGMAPEQEEEPERAAARQLVARYLTLAKRGSSQRAYDPVAHFHLSNGAELFDVHAGGDPSETGMANSWGVMVNYLYDPTRTEANHRAYLTDGTVARSARVRALLK